MARPKKPAIQHKLQRQMTEQATRADAEFAHGRSRAIAQVERNRAEIRADNWSNLYTGTGVKGRDKLESTTFSERAKLSWQTCAAMYRQLWLAKRIVDDLCSDATRAGFTLEVDQNPDVAPLVDAEWTRLHLLDRLREGLRWSLVFGGAVGLMYTEDDADPGATFGGSTLQAQSGTVLQSALAEPLTETGLQALKQIVIVDMRYAQADMTVYTTDLDSENFGKPEFYQVTPYGQAANTASYRVHWTRLLRFDGVPTDMLTRVANQSWGDSIYESAFDPLMRYGMAYQGAATAASEFGAKVLKMSDFAHLMGSKQYEAIQTRLLGVRMGLSANNMAVIDKDGEEITYLSQPLTGLDDILDRLKQEVAGMSHEPQSKLYGNQMGKVAGAEQDNEVWAQYVDGWQAQNITGNLARVTRLLFAARKGALVAHAGATWTLKPDPLEAPNLDKEVDRRLKQAQTDNIYFTIGALEPGEARVSRFGGTEYSHETVLNKTITAAIVKRDQEAAKAPAPVPVDSNAPKVGDLADDEPDDDPEDKPADPKA